MEDILEEIQELEKNNTSETTKLPPAGYKWIFTIEHKADGSVDKLKTHLIAKWYTHSYETDYQETFAPIAKLNIVCVLFSLESNLDWPLYQLDVKNAFVNDDLEEEVYMEIPSGFDTSATVNEVYKLKKLLYDLKEITTSLVWQIFQSG